MFESLKHAAQKIRSDHELDVLMRACRRLLSVRGEPNSAVVAASALAAWQHLPDAAQLRFFELLADELGPDPKVVLEAARRFAAAPSAEHLMQLTGVVEPPRQELLRRLNRAEGGTAVIVGMAALNVRAPITPYTMALQEKAIKGTMYGSVRPNTDFPKLVDLYLDGRLKIDELISRTYKLEDINEGFTALRTGQVARGVVVFN